MIALDTNILIYAMQAQSPLHDLALNALREIGEGSAPWALPDQVLGEFLRVVTHPRARSPVTPAYAIDWLDRALASPSARVLASGPTHWSILRRLVVDGNVRGNDVHDARLVAVCVEHGVERILSEDRGLRRFDDIVVVGLADRGTARERSPRYRATRRRAATMRAR